MLNHSTEPILLQKLFELLEAHRTVFRLKWTYWRNVGLVVVTHSTITSVQWSAWVYAILFLATCTLGSSL